MTIRPISVALAAVVLSGIFSPLRAEPKHKDSKPLFSLFDQGNDSIVDYEKYGDFTGVGTLQYKYYIRDRGGLIKAVGEGVYPNVSGLLQDPSFKKAQKEGQLEGLVWDYVNSENPQINFFKWASNHDQPAGIKQFYIAQMFERSSLFAAAIKAYQAAVVHFPKTIGNTFWKTPWYVGPTSLDSVAFLTRKHPELGMRLEGGRVRIRNRFDDDPHNDVYEVDPGRIVSASKKPVPLRLAKLEKTAVKRQLGKGKVHLTQYANGQWQLTIDDKPFVVRGIAYSATPIGKSPDDGSLVVHRDWMISDDNKNGKIDGPYDAWVDANRNDQQDPDEKVVGDFKLLKDMGINTVRLYHHGYNKELLRDLFTTYGIRVVMGDYIGAYTIGSGAEWYAGTDYSNPEQQAKMLASIREMVEQYKDEPYIVYWVLGNENNYGNANNSRQNPEAYYRFVNQAAELIKSIDPNHPVALCNGDVLFMDKAAKFAPAIDIYGANAYRGGHGFGDSFWRDLADEWGKPVFISEYGCPAYHHRKSREETEELQAEYLRDNWEDIERNLGGGPGVGNALGGILFEWVDEWWKAGPPPQYDSKIQDIVGQFGGPFPDGWSYEEWYGVTSQGSGKNSPYERQLRKAYFVFKDELWSSKALAKKGIPQ